MSYMSYSLVQWHRKHFLQLFFQRAMNGSYKARIMGRSTFHEEDSPEGT